MVYLYVLHRQSINNMYYLCATIVVIVNNIRICKDLSNHLIVEILKTINPEIICVHYFSQISLLQISNANLNRSENIKIIKARNLTDGKIAGFTVPE